MELTMHDEAQGAWTVLRVEGDLDLYTSPMLRERIVSLIDEGKLHVAIDLGAVGFMDSSSLGVLVSSLKRLRDRDGEMALLDVKGSPIKVLALTGLDKVFAVYGSAAELPAS